MRSGWELRTSDTAEGSELGPRDEKGKRVLETEPCGPAQGGSKTIKSLNRSWCSSKYYFLNPKRYNELKKVPHKVDFLQGLP